eukprot:COSAG05_NODE_14492_length_395_cov_0.858108_1_plen_85_part_10
MKIYAHARTHKTQKHKLEWEVIETAARIGRLALQVRRHTQRRAAVASIPDSCDAVTQRRTKPRVPQDFRCSPSEAWSSGGNWSQ